MVILNSSTIDLSEVYKLYMEKECGDKMVFDHAPSAAEVMTTHSQEEQKDPRSLFYKRVLVRPRLPVAKILLTIALAAAACLLTYFIMLRLTGFALLAHLSWALFLLMICLVFAKSIVVTAVKLYQAVAPAKLRNRCRYEPSCSAYMLLVIEKYGVWKGVFKGLVRWKGCKPPNGGYDFP